MREFRSLHFSDDYLICFFLFYGREEGGRGARGWGGRFFQVFLNFVFRRNGLYIRDLLLSFFFCCLFRFSCNIYRRNNTTILRDMRKKKWGRKKTRSKFRKSESFGTTFFCFFVFVFCFFCGCCRTNENADIIVEMMNITVEEAFNRSRNQGQERVSISILILINFFGKREIVPFSNLIDIRK